MKKLYKVFVALTALFAFANIYAQSASVTWQLTSDENPNTPTGNIQALPQSIGAGSAAPYMILYPLSPYSSNGQSLVTGYQGPGWPAGPVDYSRYIQFDLNPTAGYNFTAQYISFRYRDNPDVPINFNLLKGEVWYSLDGWNNKTQLNLDPLEYLNTAEQIFSNNINVEVLDGQTLSIRIFPYAPNGSNPMTPTLAIHKNLIVEGTASPVVTTGSICGTKFNDRNRDGLKNGDDEGLSGWTINLSMGAVQMSETTDENGEYCFIDLAPGTYTLSETQQDGWDQTHPTNPSTHTVELAAGQSVLNVDFGNKRIHGVLAGYKFNDINGNGDQQIPDEPGLANWTIILSGPVSDTTITDATGYYLFNNLPAGTYTITEENQLGWQATYPSSGSYTLILSEGEGSAWNFGNRQVGSICGIKFNDLDGDGEKDEGEPGLSGWVITLSMGAVQMSDTTDENGEYCFNDLVPGTYTLSETEQDGWQQTYPTNTSTHTIELAAGENILDVDFGNMQYGSVGGMKFNDLDGDGEKDQDEPGISGFTIALSVGGSPGGDGVSISTDENGEFHFDNVPPGIYTLQELQQNGWDQTHPDSPGYYTLTITSGLNIIGKDFGNKQLLGSICGMKFNDLNGNEQNDNEPGLSGWIITLSMGAVQMSDTTDENGEYCFNNLVPGTYTLSETQQDGWQQTAPVSGSHTITINSEVNLIGIDFGNKEILDPNCTDFENNSMNGWQANNISTSILQDGNNHYIQTTDQAGVSTFYTTSKPYTGNWTSLFSNGCGSLCFDINFIYGGNVYQGQTPPQTLTPYIALEGAGFKASFVVNQTISVGDGWHTFCAPLSFLNSDGTLPSNSDGYWIMTVGTANDWNSLLTNVTQVRLLADPTSFQGEKIGYDNICLSNTGDCDPVVQLGSICGLKILDKDGDGERDSNEDIIPNWEIFLTDGNSYYTATTDENGEYCFNDLPAGTYTVSEGQLTGWKQIFPPDPGIHTITLLPGENITNINFSNVEDITVQLGSICGFKFNDKNDNGRQDDGEFGLPNWTFQLSGAANMTATTDQFGNFCFYNLSPGDYTITEVIQDGWEPTTPNSSGTYSFTLLPGENREGILFGNKEKLGQICGMKYNDLNGDGNWDQDEPGLSGWRISISLWGYTASGHASGPTLDEIAVDTTDENGNYCFTNLRQGSYLIGEYPQNNWTQTEPATFAYSITLTPGQIIDNLNFGNKEDVTARLGSICGIKFNDKDGDGEQDPGELGIPEWQINLGGPRDLTVYTDKEGKFCFDDLPPGEYKVGETMINGWRQTVPPTNFYIVQLASGENITDLIFGNTEDKDVQLGSICGTKFYDKNRDGRKVDSEPGIANWTIYLEGPMNLTVVTDDQGNYCFYGLIPGTYTVREANRTGWRQSKPSSITYTLEVGNGDNFSGIDFGNFEDPSVTFGSICGFKFNDLDGDGIKQDNEPFIPNWTINLSGTMNLTTRTDSRGKFCFENLIFGRYTIYEAQKDGWRQTAPSTGSYTFELSEDNSSLDTFYFGNQEDISVKVGSICGMKFFDKDGDGSKGLTEPGIADWQINISGPVDRSITTDKNGEFCFDDLPPGTYIIKEEPRTDWVQTYPTSPNDYTVTLTSGESLIGYYFGNKYEPKPGCVDPPSGMKAWWSFDYSSRDARQDLAGFNNYGTMINGPLQVAGKVLGALQFDGVDDYVEVDDHFELNFGTGDFSFDAWIKTSSNSGITPLVDKRDNSNGVGYSFFLHNGNLAIQLNAGPIENNYVSTLFAADGNWHHIAITVSRKDKNGIIFYLDGAATQHGDPTLHMGSLNNNRSLRIGREFGTFASIFKGILDEIELFKRVLTPAEVQAIYNAGSAGKCKPNTTGGSVSGGVWYDFNHNGVKDPNEDGLAQWPVLLNGPSIALTETGSDGNFVFTDLKPGDYTLSVASRNNYACTYPFGGRFPFKLEEGQSLAAFNFGFADDPCTDGQKSWYPLGSGVNGGVFALAAEGNNIYAGGSFSVAGGVNVRNIAKWNGSNWEDVGGGVNGMVYSMVFVGNKLYIGGIFSFAGNIGAKNIAMWDGSSWHALGDGVNGVVRALETNNTMVYAGGDFTTAGNMNASHIAQWNGFNWSALGSGLNDDVHSLEVSGIDLIAGGKFTSAGNVNSARVAKWNTVNSSWLPMGSGLNNIVNTLAAKNGEIYAGGAFNNIVGANSLNCISKWDGTTWISLGNGVYGVSNNIVYASLFIDDELFVGGTFTIAGLVQVNGVAKWDGSYWTSLGSGVGGYGFNQNIVMALVEKNSELFAGGSFTIAGRVNANGIAKYSCSGTVTSVEDDKLDNVVPSNFKLDQNYPNPFNPSSTIRYHIPKASYVKITVYDILGREIKVLVNEKKNPGLYEVFFNARGLASGVYFYTIRTSEYTQSKKMILLK